MVQQVVRIPVPAMTLSEGEQPITGARVVAVTTPAANVTIVYKLCKYETCILESICRLSSLTVQENLALSGTTSVCVLSSTLLHKVQE